MKILSFVILSLLIVLLSCSTACSACNNDRDVFDCLKAEISKKNKSGIKYWENFWIVYQEADKKASQCIDIKDTASFFEAGAMKYGEATSEYFTESIEKLFVKNPKCFFDAVLLLQEKQRNKIVEYIALPTFTGDQEMLDKKVLKFQKIKKYKEVADLYFEMTKHVERRKVGTTN